MRRRSHPAVLLVCLVLVLGCAKEAPPAPEPSTTPAAGATMSDPLTAALGRAQAPRRIIRNGEINLEIADPAAARAKVVRIVDEAGGYLASSQSATGNERSGQGDEELGIRIPADRFMGVLAKLRNLGTVSSEHITSSDVTDEFVDLDARVVAGHAVETQYLAMLEKAKTVSDMLAVQHELGNVRTELERLEGKRRLLGDQTTLSSISVRLTVPLPLVTASWRELRADGLQAGASILNVSAALISWILRVLSVLLPVTALLGAPLYFAVKAFARRVHAHPSQPRPSV